MMRSPAMLAASLAALLLLPGSAQARKPYPAPAWLAAVPAPRRSSLVMALRELLSAEAHQDWDLVYRVRPYLDRRTESKEQFIRRWNEIMRATALDFEPLRASESPFAAVSDTERVFDVMGCTQVEREGKTAGQEGSISAHLEDGTWYLDGVHLLTDDDDQPEPCDFHAAHGVLASASRRH